MRRDGRLQVDNWGTGGGGTGEGGGRWGETGGEGGDRWGGEVGVI